jgi:diacylglycerol kinase
LACDGHNGGDAFLTKRGLVDPRRAKSFPGVTCRLNAITRVLLIGSVLLVMIVEILNSAIEAVVDRIGSGTLVIMAPQQRSPGDQRDDNRQQDRRRPHVFGAPVLLIGSVLLVMIVEILNSAIEAVVDRIGSDYHEVIMAPQQRSPGDQRDDNRQQDRRRPHVFGAP